MESSNIIAEKFQTMWNGINKAVFLPLLRRYRAKHYAELSSLCLITSNCIGGVWSNAYGFPFRSPTINLFMEAPDFVSFAEHLDVSLHSPLVFFGNVGYPVGRIGNSILHFVHYSDFLSAKAKWVERAKRVELSKVVLILCERDGCTPETVERFSHLPYPKILLAGRPYPYEFAITVKPTWYEKRHGLNPMNRLMNFGSCGRRRFEKFITPTMLLHLVGKGT